MPNNRNNILVDPRGEYYHDAYPAQQQEPPGLESRMQPRPDTGEESYRGHGRLLGRKALITGGDSGIGRAVAIAFAREGADIAVNYLPAEQPDAASLRTLLDSEGSRLTLLPGDLSDEQSCRRIVRDAVRALDGLDTLVLNAGTQHAVKEIAHLSTEQLEYTFATNVFSLFWSVQEALPHIFDPGFPAVVVPDRLRRIEKRRRGVHPLAGQTARTEGNPRQLGRSRPRLDTVAGERRAAAREYPRFRKPDTAGACRATRRSSAELRLSRLRRVELHYRPDHRRHGRTLHSLNPATMRTPAAHPDRLTAEERRELDDNAFGIPSRREFPLVDAAHVRAAESYFRYAPEADKPALARRILRQAAEFGIEIRSETILRWAAQTAKR